MTFKYFINQILLVFILLFIGVTTASFVVPEGVKIPDWYRTLNFIVRENWAILALILSEIAAILPGKPKGIIHAILQIGNKVKGKKSTTKIGGSYEN